MVIHCQQQDLQCVFHPAWYIFERLRNPFSTLFAKHNVWFKYLIIFNPKKTKDVSISITRSYAKTWISTYGWKAILDFYMCCTLFSSSECTWIVLDGVQFVSSQVKRSSMGKCMFNRQFIFSISFPLTINGTHTIS